MTLCCVRGVWLPPLPGGYLWLPLVTSVTRYCMTLCCVPGVWLPPLPGGYLWLLCVTSVTRYCMTLCCVRGVWLPPLPGGYLWSPLVTSVTRYCMTLCCVHGVRLPQLPAWWLPAVTMCYQHYQVLLDSMLCTWNTVTSVTLWVLVVTFGYGCYLVLQYPRLYTLCTGQHCYHNYLCLASSITIIVQWIHCIVALPELPLLPVTWACSLTASPPYLA